MVSAVLAGTGWVARKTLVMISLGFIGLLVGIGCVLMPIGIPFGIVGLVGLILLWTMPDLQSVPVRLARRTLIPLLVVNTCVPVYLGLIVPGAPYMSIRRVVLFLFVGAFAITLCGSSKYRALLTERLKASPILFYVIAAYICLTILTLPISTSPATTVNAIVQDTMLWYLPLLATVLFVEKNSDFATILEILVICLLVDFVLGGIEYRLQRPFLFQLLPATSQAYIMEINPFFANALTGSFRDGQYRATAIYNTGLSWAEMVAMTAPACAFLVLEVSSMRGRLIGVAGLVGGFLSLLYSGSRGGLVCSMIALGVYALFWAIRQVRQRPESLFGGLALYAASLVVGTGVLAVTFVGRIHGMVLGGGGAASSDQGRAMQWAAAWPQIWHSPIWGYGLGTAGGSLDVKVSVGQTSLDDYRINLLLDNGILGFALYFGMIIVAVCLCARMYIMQQTAASTAGAAIACGLMAYLVDRTSLSQVENNTLMFVFVGLAFALNRLANGQKAVSASLPPARS